MSEFSPKTLSSDDQLTIDIGDLIERARPETSVRRAMNDFSFMIITTHWLKDLSEQFKNDRGREAFRTASKIAQAKLSFKTKEALIKVKMSNPEYAGTMNRLNETFLQDQPLDFTKSMLLIDVIKHTIPLFGSVDNQ